MIYLMIPMDLPQVRHLPRAEQMRLLKEAAQKMAEEIEGKFPEAKTLDAMVIGTAVMEMPPDVADEVEKVFRCRLSMDRRLNIKLGCGSQSEDK